MSNDYQRIVTLLEDFLGDTKSGINDNLQVQFCCPECNPGGSFHKYNLEVNLKKKVFQCWSCSQTNNMSGKLSTLVRKYGGQSYLTDYRNILKDIKASQAYEFKYIGGKRMLDDEDEDDSYDENDDLIGLPEGCFSFDFNSYKQSQYYALKYLKERGIGENIIKKHNIKYTFKNCSENRLNFRIILPSYDSSGSLNFWTGRDYTGKNKNKYYNYDVQKKEIIFNEKLINWNSAVTLVEGPFDHVVTPNSIPLLGKILKKDFYLYNVLIERCKSDVLIFLDNDAEKSSVLIYNLLNNTKLKDRVKVVPTPNGYDPSLLYEEFGYKKICELLNNSIKLNNK